MFAAPYRNGVGFGAGMIRVAVHTALLFVAGAVMDLPRMRVAHAEDLPTLEGRWSAGPLTTKWVIGDWGTACGPKPSGGGEAAASVIVKQSGSELVLTGGGRTYATTQCWEQYPGIQRISHSASARAWKSSCKTPAGDPRQASLATSLTATNDALSLYEAGQYQFVIQGQNCTASVGRYRTYTLVQRAGTAENPAPSASSAEKAAAAPTRPAVPTSTRCATPGPAARLEVRPARKLLKGGEEFSFRAIVSDASGCQVQTRPTWQMESPSTDLELTPTGTVTVKPDAKEGEVRISASVGGRSASVAIEIATADRYDALLRSGAFNALGEVDEAAMVAIASQSIGAGAAVAADAATDRKRLFVGAVIALAAALGIVGLVLLLRARRRAQPPSSGARRAPLPSPTPVASRPGASAPLPAAMAAAAAPKAPASAPPPPPAPARNVCPICGTQYPPKSRFCGKDGATLLPVN